MKLNLEPKKVFNFFYDINQIPRGSHNEDGVVAYISNFAKERDLQYFVDDAKNVIVKKPATKGYEDRPAIILQGHTDMVTEKTAQSTHDFEKDPIEMIVDGEWLRANDTTLGADNGIAVAMALAVLDSDDLEHGPLECLFTATEETGMDGAIGLDPTPLTGKYLLNIDTEEEDEFIVSCAGGVGIVVSVPLLKETPDSIYTTGLRIKATGLKGGHSGLEIIKQRANAIQLMARTLYELSNKFRFQMAYFEGGSKHNAIPSSAEAYLAIRAEDKEAILAYIKEKESLYRSEFTPADPDLALKTEDADLPKQVYNKNTTVGLLSYVYIAPHGVVRMSQNIEGLVETSLNIAIVREEEEKRQMTIIISLRGSSFNPLHYLKERLVVLAHTIGVKAVATDSYPAWEYEPNSDLEMQAKEVYTKVFGREPKINAVHAGLECGLLKNHLPNTQMISFGPDIEKAHTPRERVHIESVGRIYNFLCQLIKELK